MMVKLGAARMVIAVSACWAAVAAEAGTTWRRVSDREFPGWRAELQRFVNRARSPVAHVCVVVRSDAGDPRDAVLLAYLSEEKYIQGFGRPTDGSSLDDAAMAGSDAIDLRKDVVATEREINGSTSRVTKAYVDDIVAHCRTEGTWIAITRKRR